VKEVAVVSGKGGTGKTSITASLVVLSGNAVAVDGDVDAANLHLLLQPSVRETRDFYGSRKAVIDPEQCTSCGLCAEVCRFDAIYRSRVNPLFCEGCGVCHHSCPEGAISMREVVSGRWFVSDTPYGPLVHAHLNPAEGNSGKLVTLLRKRAREVAMQIDARWIFVDGPPGIGCPVIACLSGADAALLVTEATATGLRDLQRVLAVCRRFGVTAGVCLNRYDLDPAASHDIEDFCRREGLPIFGKIPFDRTVVDAVVAGLTPVERGPGPAAAALRQLWATIQAEWGFAGQDPSSCRMPGSNRPML